MLDSLLAVRRSNSPRHRLAALLAIGACVATPAAHADLFLSSGSDPAHIQPTVDDFRDALGGSNNGVGGSFETGRREINWDGVPNASSAPGFLAQDFFNVISPRGLLLFTDGAAFQVSASTPSGNPVRFGNLNVTYPDDTQTFSAEKLLTALGGNTIEIEFRIPGTDVPALVKGFGAVFTDVEIPAGTTITPILWDGANGGQYDVPISGAAGLSFLGLTDPEGFRSVVIRQGTALPASTENLALFRDVVFIDDVIYGEPQLPEPGATLSMLAAVAALARLRRAR